MLVPIAVLCLVLGLFPNLVLDSMGEDLDARILTAVKPAMRVAAEHDPVPVITELAADPSLALRADRLDGSFRITHGSE